MVDAVTSQPSTALGNALQISAYDLIENGFSGQIDEEITTAALLGLIASNIAWCTALTTGRDLPPISWVHYSKHKSDGTSESYSGADFALVIKTSPFKFRAAIFQAKRSKSSKLNFLYHQISPAVEGFDPEPQFLRLSKHGLRTLAACRPRTKKSTPTFKELGFVHYLVYDKSSCPCSAITEFEDKYIELINFQGSAKPDEIKDEESIRSFWSTHSERLLYSNESLRVQLGELLALGANTPSGKPAKGWLELTSFRQAENFITSTQLLMDVFETSPNPKLKPTLGRSIARSQPGEIRQGLVSKLQAVTKELKASSQDQSRKIGKK